MRSGRLFRIVTSSYLRSQISTWLNSTFRYSRSMRLSFLALPTHAMATILNDWRRVVRATETSASAGPAFRLVSRLQRVVLLTRSAGLVVVKFLSVSLRFNGLVQERLHVIADAVGSISSVGLFETAFITCLPFVEGVLGGDSGHTAASATYCVEATGVAGRLGLRLLNRAEFQLGKVSLLGCLANVLFRVDPATSTCRILIRKWTFMRSSQ